MGMGIEVLAPDGVAVEQGDTRFWAQVYDGIALRFDRDHPFPFLNLGFVVPSRSPEVDVEDPCIWDRLAEGLYDRTLAGIDVDGLSILEVGCGLGGGCAYIAATRNPAEVVGLDISAAAVNWCADRHRSPQLEFRRGDAERLPYPAQRFDLLLNVESSHCYQSRSRFFAEATRVLRPGGTFAFADVFISSDTEPLERMERLMPEAGLRIVDCSNVTDGVLEARRLVSRSRAHRARLEEILPDPELANAFGKLAFMPGTSWYEQLTAGRLQYWCITAIAESSA